LVNKLDFSEPANVDEGATTPRWRYGVSDRAGARTWNRLYDGWSLSWMYTAGSQHRCTVTSNFTMATT